jgi:hypothetical protein
LAFALGCVGWIGGFALAGWIMADIAVLAALYGAAILAGAFLLAAGVISISGWVERGR